MEDIFEKYKNLKAYYETSDKCKFFLESDAKNHAKDLKEKTVKKIEPLAVKQQNNKIKQAIKTQELKTK